MYLLLLLPVLLKIHLVPGQMITVVCLDFMMTMAHAPHVRKMQTALVVMNTFIANQDIINTKLIVIHAPGMCAMVKHLSVVAPGTIKQIVADIIVKNAKVLNIVPLAQPPDYA